MLPCPEYNEEYVSNEDLLKNTIYQILSIPETDYVIDYYNKYKKNQDQNFKNHIQIIKE